MSWMNEFDFTEAIGEVEGDCWEGEDDDGDGDVDDEDVDKEWRSLVKAEVGESWEESTTTRDIIKLFVGEQGEGRLEDDDVDEEDDVEESVSFDFVFFIILFNCSL